MSDLRVTEPRPCFWVRRAMRSLDIDHLMNSQDASLFLAPTGMPQPCEATPGKRPLGPLGSMAKFDVFMTLLPSSPISAQNAWLWAAELTRPARSASVT